ALFLLVTLVPACGQQMVEFADPAAEAGADSDSGALADGGNDTKPVGTDGGDATPETPGSDGTVVAPVVTSTDPPTDATSVIVSSAVRATFSKAMNASTLNGATFLLKDGTTAVPGAVTYAGTTATFSPSTPLAPN